MKPIDEIRAFVCAAFYPREDLGDHDSLFDSGTMDSTGTLELIAFLEQRYAVSVADAEIRPENLDSIAAAADFVTRKLASA